MHNTLFSKNDAVYIYVLSLFKLQKNLNIAAMIIIYNVDDEERERESIIVDPQNNNSIGYMHFMLFCFNTFFSTQTAKNDQRQQRLKKNLLVVY